MKIKLLFYLFMACTLLAASCRKKAKTYYLDPWLKNYIHYKEGSYWIMQNDGGFEDSLYVWQLQENFGNPNSLYDKDKYEYIILNIDINSLDTDFVYTGGYSIYTGQVTAGKYQEIVLRLPGGGLAEPLIYVPWKQAPSTDNNISAILDVPETTVNGNNFSNAYLCIYNNRYGGKDSVLTNDQYGFIYLSYNLNAVVRKRLSVLRQNVLK